MAITATPPPDVLPADRIIVMAAPNGARRGKSDHARLPITPEELATEAVALRDAGVGVLHLHVRDARGEHTLDADAYRAAIAAIHGRVGDDLVLQVTTEAVGRYRPPQQMALVRELRPEAVSLALPELCPDEAAEAAAGEFFRWVHEAGIWAQYILYSPAQLQRFDRLRRQGFFGTPTPFCLFVLGRYADGVPGDEAGLAAFLDAVDCDEFPWAVCCFGPREGAVMQAAARAGGHVRLGFENNLVRTDGSPAADNAELIRDFTAALGDARQPATAAGIRAAFMPSRRAHA